MLNWIAHLDALQLAGSALVGATDDATVAGLIAARTRARCFPLTSAIGAAEAKWGSPGFSQMGRTKSKLLRTLLTMHATVLFADADVAFLRDPLPYIQTQIALGADVLFHTDGFGSSPFAKLHGDSALEQPSFGWGPELNTGLFLATPKALKLSEEWCEVLKSDAAFANWKNDQQTLNELMRQGVRISPPSDAKSTNLIDAFNGRLKLGLLPSHLFPSGHVYFIQRQLRSIQDTAPYAIHLTFQNCDQSGKRHRMREARLWMVDPPSYYNPPNGLLSYTPDLPPELTSQFNSTSALPQTRNLHGSDAVLASHFALINHQLLQVRTALALALVLNRTLVLPRFLCGLETVTNFAHSGVRCRGSRDVRPSYRTIARPITSCACTTLRASCRRCHRSQYVSWSIRAYGMRPLLLTIQTRCSSSTSWAALREAPWRDRVCTAMATRAHTLRRVRAVDRA